jgi:tetratricopeptide (TPR) repeat protein
MARARAKSGKPSPTPKNVGMSFPAKVLTLRLRKEKWRSVVLGVVLVILTISAFLPALRAGFIWDDDQHLTANRCIVGPLGFRAIWTTSSAVYYPLVLTSFWIQHAIWGLNPFFFHLVNVLMHAMNAVILWRVLLRLEVAGAWLGAALWALHPVQVESVAWITELKNTQSCFFYLLALLFFLKWRAVVGSGKKGSAILDYALIILFAVLAILSKASTVMLPLVLGLCWWWKERNWRWHNAIWLLPFVMLSAAASVWTVWEQKFHSAALGAEWSQSGVERLATAGKAVWFYLGKLLWPHPLVFVYPRWRVDLPEAISLAPLLAAVLMAVVLWLGRKDRRLRSGFFAFTYFSISLFPVMGFFNVYFFRYSFVADHFQYLASIGIVVFVAAGLNRLPRQMQMLPAVLLVILMVLTWQQTKIYGDQETLWRDTLAKNPVAWMAHNNLGNVLTDRGKLPEAIQHLEQSIQLKPDNAEAYFNLGNALARQGKLSEAIQYYEQAIQIKPNYAAAYDILGNALAGQGRVSEAIQHYLRAIELKPEDAEAYNNLGSALILLGKLPEAIQRYEKAVELKPGNADFWYNLGLALDRQAKLPRAIQCYERAVQLKPDDAEVLGTLAAAYAENRHYSEAVEVAKRAIERAGAAGNSTLVRTMESRLTLYEARAAGSTH